LVEFAGVHPGQRALDSGKTYSSLGASDKVAVRAHAFARLGSPDGPFRLTAKVRAVRGTR
jgi:hypothetical protein